MLVWARSIKDETTARRSRKTELNTVEKMGLELALLQLIGEYEKSHGCKGFDPLQYSENIKYNDDGVCIFDDHRNTYVFMWGEDLALKDVWMTETGFIIAEMYDLNEYIGEVVPAEAEKRWSIEEKPIEIGLEGNYKTVLYRLN